MLLSLLAATVRVKYYLVAVVFVVYDTLLSWTCDDPAGREADSGAEGEGLQALPSRSGAFLGIQCLQRWSGVCHAGDQSESDSSPSAQTPGLIRGCQRPAPAPASRETLLRSSSLVSISARSGARVNVNIRTWGTPSAVVSLQNGTQEHASLCLCSGVVGGCQVDSYSLQRRFSIVLMPKI